MNAPYSRSATAPPWHSLATAQVANELCSDPAQGLTDAEVAVRLAERGPNRLAEKPPRPAWRKFLDQFRNFLVIVLIGAAVLAGTVGDLKDAIVIAIVVLLNATLGFVQEHRAESALAALKNMLAPVARVRRSAQPTLVPASNSSPATSCYWRPATAFRPMRASCPPMPPRWRKQPSPGNLIPSARCRPPSRCSRRSRSGARWST